MVMSRRDERMKGGGGGGGGKGILSLAISISLRAALRKCISGLEVTRS